MIKEPATGMGNSEKLRKTNTIELNNICPVCSNVTTGLFKCNKVEKKERNHLIQISVQLQLVLSDPGFVSP